MRVAVSDDLISITIPRHTLPDVTDNSRRTAQDGLYGGEFLEKITRLVAHHLAVTEHESANATEHRNLLRDIIASEEPDPHPGHDITAQLMINMGAYIANPAPTAL